MSTLADTAEAGQDRRIVLTLSGDAARVLRQIARDMDVSVAEVARRALGVLDLVLSLDEGEDLVIRNRKTKEMERVRFDWALRRR